MTNSYNTTFFSGYVWAGGWALPDFTSPYSTWPSQVAAQPAAVISTAYSAAGNDTCGRHSVISIGQDFPKVARWQCRRYFLDPLAKVVTTNFDAATSCFTVPTPTTLSDGRWGWEFDITGPIQSVNLAMPKQKELTVGVACV